MSANQSRGDLHPRFADNTIEGLPRYAHPFSRFGVIKVFNVRQPQRLQPVGADFDFLKFIERYPSRLEIVCRRALRDGWRAKKFTIKELAAAAAVCRVSRVMQPYLEMLT